MWRPTLFLLVLLGMLAVSRFAQADRLQLLVGPQAGYLSSGGGALLGVDATWVPYRDGMTWLSAGLRGARPDGGTRWMPYAEVGVWALANLGLGVTVATGGAPKTGVLAHLFLGLPFGAFDLNARFIEPYYRPMYGSLFGDRGFHHEIGILLKIGYLAHRPMRFCC